nr:DUF4199 domain-containing protein [Bacteroidota bacterium]
MKKFLLPALIFTVFSMSMVVLTILKIVSNESGSNWIAIVLYFIVYFFLLRYIKIKHFDNNMTFKAIFKAGVTLALVSAVMVSVCYFIYCNFINYEGFREFMDKQMEIQIQKQIDNGTYNLKMESMFKFFGSIESATIFAGINTIFFGTIYSLIIALALKNKEETDEMGVPLQN